MEKFKLEDFPFEDLPIEIQGKIVRSVPMETSKSITLKLNQEIREDVLINECLNSISKIELQKYKNKMHPYSIVEFYHIPRFNGFYAEIKSFSAAVSPANDFNVHLESISHYIGRNDSRGHILAVGIRDVNSFFGNGKKELIYYDLVTTYHILKTRLSCSTYDSKFAKKAVIDTFDYMYTYLDDVDEILVYLRAHASIMSIIPDKSYPMKYLLKNDDDDDTIENVYNLINSETKFLYQKIRKYLMILDDELYYENSSVKYIMRG